MRKNATLREYGREVRKADGGRGERRQLVCSGEVVVLRCRPLLLAVQRILVVHSQASHALEEACRASSTLVLLEKRRYTHRGMRKYMAESRVRHTRAVLGQRESSCSWEKERKKWRGATPRSTAPRHRPRSRLLHATSQPSSSSTCTLYPRTQSHDARTALGRVTYRRGPTTRDTTPTHASPQTARRCSFSSSEYTCSMCGLSLMSTVECEAWAP